MKNFFYLLIAFGFPFQILAQNNAEISGTTHNYIFKDSIKLYLPEPPRPVYNVNRSATYTIPVVFHIVHQYGPENISDAQVYDAIEQINTQLRKRNADTTDIDPLFKSIAADVDIEVRLAHIDPDGNCTNGITRTASPLTLPGDHTVKSVIHWPPDQYLNIYVCKDAAGLAGHSLLPEQADTIPQWDGIVMRHDYIGTIGTSDYFRRTVVTHEIGHYFNLQHIWGGNNVPDYYYLPVADAGNCAYDDGVADTPETICWQTCQSNPQSCGTPDNIQNYMDYAYCARMFTEGQKARMHAALNSSVANRNNLWQPANLIATGTDGSANLCKAKFEATENIICAGSSLDLYDLSYHGVTNRNWTINGASLSSSTDSLITATFSTPGWYDVTLQVTDGTNTIDTTISNYIRVLPAQGQFDYLIEEFENEAQYLDGWTEVITGNSSFDIVNVGTGYNSYKSLRFNNFTGLPETKLEVISNPIDVSSLSQLTIAFDYAFAAQDAANHDMFQVLISDDCGQSWVVRKSLYADINLSTSPSIITPFTPSGDNEWAHEEVTIPSNFLTGNLMVKFLLKNDGGNDLYLDNVNIAHPDALYVEEEKSKSEIDLYPNPSNGAFTIQSNEPIEQISIIDASGRLVYSEKLNTPSYVYQNQMSKGMYFVKIQTKMETLTKSIIID